MSNSVNQNESGLKVRGIADIVFCIDKSGSMEHCIDGVVRNISNFVSKLENLSANVVVDWKLGVALYSGTTINFLDLTNNASIVKNFVSGVKLEWNNEFTPGAIDYVVTNSSWRSKSHRVVVVFTDESLMEGGSGYNLDYTGEEKFPQIIDKLLKAKIQLLYFGPYCEYYDQFGMLPKALINTVDNFNNIDFSELLKKIALTVTASSTNAQIGTPIPPLVYDLSEVTISKQ